MRLPSRVLLALFVLLLPTVAAPPRSLAQASVVKLATLVPEGSVWDKALRDMGADWSTATAGRVTLRVYPGGVAGDEPDVVRKMRIGQLQAAAVTTAGLASIDPSFNIFNVPMFFTSYPELYATLDKLEPVLKQRLDAKGFVLLSWGHGGWVFFFTKNPVESLDGLKHTKMFTWAGDDQMVQMWKQKGFNPVPLAATDIMTGLQTGMIDAYPTTPLLGLTLQWYRQTPNMVGMGMAPLVGGLIMAKPAWLKLSDTDRAKVQAACDKMEKRLELEVPRQDTTAVAEMLKRGLHVVPVSAANQAQFRSEAEEFATQLTGVRIPVDIVMLARKERDAFRARTAGK
jgi:TRAP-type C4-dicarboxylate transport system substrate-binding protein